MFFYLSKILVFLTSPFNLIVIFMALSLILKAARWRRWLRRTAVMLFLVFTIGVIQNEFLLIWEVPAIPLSEIKGVYEVGIVLGGTTDTERAPFDRLYFTKGAERVTQALQLYKEGKIQKILFTGGRSRLFEGREKDNRPVRDFLVMAGVRPGDIIIENRARNTHENAVLTRALLEKMGLMKGKHILLTSAFHMRRAEGCFKKEGIDVLGFSTDFYSQLPKYRFSAGMFVPSVRVLDNWNFLIKEIIGYIVYDFVGYL